MVVKGPEGSQHRPPPRRNLSAVGAENHRDQSPHRRLGAVWSPRVPVQNLVACGEVQLMKNFQVPKAARPTPTDRGRQRAKRCHPHSRSRWQWHLPDCGRAGRTPGVPDGVGRVVLRRDRAALGEVHAEQGGARAGAGSNSLIDSGDRRCLGINSKGSPFAEWAGTSIQLVGVDVICRMALGTRSCRRSGIDLEFQSASEAEVFCVVSDTESQPLMVWVVGVLLLARFINEVRIAV